MACRRGGVHASDIGAIHVGRRFSVVEIAEPAAESFARAAGEPDPRDPRVRISHETTRQERPGPRDERPIPRERPSARKLRDEAPAPHVPRERPSARKVRETRDEAPQAPAVPRERASARKLREEAPEAPAKPIPRERASSRKVNRDAYDARDRGESHRPARPHDPRHDARHDARPNASRAGHPPPRPRAEGGYGKRPAPHAPHAPHASSGGQAPPKRKRIVVTRPPK
jgi:hypothetical protein